MPRLNRKILLESEISILPKRQKKWTIRAAAVFPGTYKAGMSNLGFLTLFEKMHDFHQFFPQRFFSDFGPYSLEENEPLSSFSLIAASISYELDYIKFIKMLREGGIKISNEEREDGRLLIIGGAAVTINPYPMLYIADAIFIGEGIEYIEKILTVIAENPPGITPKIEILKNLSNVPGVWVPLLSDSPPRRAISKARIPPSSKIISSFSSFPNMVLVQIQRGCPYGCPFCATPYNFNPFLNYDIDSILEQLMMWGEMPKRVGLVGSAISDHPQIADIFDKLSNSEVYTSSLRADKLSPELLEKIRASKQKTLTFAPETGSERLKKIIKKFIYPENIVEVAEKTAAKEIKLYYIIGMPDEKINDVKDTIREIKIISKALRKKRVKVSINPFVPKRGTPWESFPMETHESLMEKFKIISDNLKNVDNLKLDINYNRRLRAQWLLSCGGQEISRILIESRTISELAAKARKLGWDV